MNRVNDAESYGYPAVVGYFSYGAYREWPWGDAVAREAAADAVRVSDALRKLDIEAIMFFLGELSTAACCKWPVHGVWGMNIGVACGLAPAA